jgi:TonB-linked SusC/RagA family outer membrane protein
MPLMAWAQFNVKGVVRDKTDVLIGATVVEVGNPTNGTVTNVDGVFNIKVKSNKSKIKISYIGYTTQTHEVSANMDITLESDGVMLGEVEVVQQGFTTKSRISNIASISSIQGAVLRSSPTTSIQNALAGRLPGLFQLQASGQPGNDAADIFIRGISTFADVSVSPLVLIDDIESDVATLSQLSPNDIQDVSVLKDAGSTAIFGLKGANGVILVTTRRGTEGKPKITFRGDWGLQQPTYKNKFLGSYESLKLIKELYMNDDNQSSLSDPMYSDESLEHYRTKDDPYHYPDVDWYNLVYRNLSLQQQYNVDVQGGTDKVKYFVSVGYVDQDGLLKNVPRADDINNQYYLKRYNLRSNFDVQITKTLLFKVNANAILSQINSPHMPNPGESGTFSFFFRMMSGRLNPWSYPAYNPDGTFGMKQGGSMNPLALLSQGGYDRKWDNNVNGNITLQQKLDFITKGLTIRGVMGLTNRWGTQRQVHRADGDYLAFYYDQASDSYMPINKDTYVLRPMSVSEKIDGSTEKPYVQINTRLDLTYNRKFGGHNVSGLLLANWYSNRTAADTPHNSISYSGRLSYDYFSRYLFEVSAAYNGSDRFAKGNRYDIFPAVTLGWNMAEEPYMKKFWNKIKVDLLKLRGSYGISGADAVPGNTYTYLEIYGADGNYPFGDQYSSSNTIAGYVLTQLANSNVKWESEKKLNLGVDLRMLNNRLSITYEYFSNRRYDILTKPTDIPLYAGYTDKVLPRVNLGVVKNHGWDLEVNWRDKVNKDFSYVFRGIVSYAKNKIVDMGENPSPYVLSMETGHPVGTLFGYVADGFYLRQEEIDNGPYDALRSGNVKLGDLKYKDISGPNGVPDGVISEYDKVAIGNSRPDFNYGLTIGFSYKNFDFSTLFQGATGASVSTKTVLTLGGTDGRPRPLQEGRWTPYDSQGQLVTDPDLLYEMNKNASFPRLSANNGNNNDLSTFWLRSANYIRWKNMELGYNIPQKWMRRIGMQSARVYASAQNLVTWSGLNDYQIDPESTTNKAGSNKGAIDTYPQQRVFNFGCQITF